jgi:hypothetical protein
MFEACGIDKPVYIDGVYRGEERFCYASRAAAVLKRYSRIAGIQLGYVDVIGSIFSDLGCTSLTDRSF